MTPSEHRLIKAAVDMRMAQKKYFELCKQDGWNETKCRLSEDIRKLEYIFDFILKDIQNCNGNIEYIKTIKT